jgi:hypothetical protein
VNYNTHAQRHAKLTKGEAQALGKPPSGKIAKRALTVRNSSVRLISRTNDIDERRADVIANG